MKNRLFSNILLVVVTMTVATSCKARQETEHPNPPLRVEFTQWWGDYTLLVAKEKGIFEKYGVDVEPVYYDVYPEIYPDLASGQIDGALIAVGDVINIHNTTPMKVVALNDDGGADSIVVGPEINSVQDLKGKVVGVLIGTQYELMVAEMLRSAGVSVGDITLVNVNPENALDALKSGEVQAVYTWEPHLSRAIVDGNKVIYPTKYTRLFPDTIVFSQSVVDSRPDDVRAFLKAWFQAVEYRLQHQGETRDIAAKYLGVSAEDVQPDDNQRLYTVADNKNLFNINEANSIYAITNITSDYLISIGTITQLTDPLELLDPSYLP
ncbi:MAG: ABC transporter substrate-binding protein [Chloroflexi bacterium]|nr:ABC transporter substrate-binding protein [Chloroflexota bacterium]